MGQIVSFLVERLRRKSEEPTLPISRPIHDSSRPVDPPSEEYWSPDTVQISVEEPILPIRRPIQDSPFKSSRSNHQPSHEYSRRDSLPIPVEEPSLLIRRLIHESQSKSSGPIHQPSQNYLLRDSLPIPVEKPTLPSLRPINDSSFPIHPPSQIDSFLDSLLIPDEKPSHEYSFRDSLPIPVEKPALPIHESPFKSSRPIHQPSQNYSLRDSLPIPVEKPTRPSLRPINDSSFPIHPPSQINSFLDSLLIPDEKPSQEYSFRDSVRIPWESVESIGESISYEPPPTVESRRESTSRRSKKKDKGKTMAITEKWLKHYSSGQKILLVGEGDFSFSASLAMAFGTATNIIATSLNSRGFLNENYKKAPTNIEKLTSRGCKVIHGVDVHKMTNHPSLNALQFDRLIFNFPHAGFIPNQSPNAELRRHRRLIRKFLANGKKMINKRGEIHITHKCNKFFLGWNLELLANNEGLMLKEEVKFDFKDYPGYNTKYGFGGDKNFNCYPSKTYKFALESPKKSKSKIDIL